MNPLTGMHRTLEHCVISLHRYSTKVVVMPFGGCEDLAYLRVHCELEDCISSGVGGTGHLEMCFLSLLGGFCGAV